jgi:peptidoglycan/xylan/chitin deacetylase (PgdA/CDA1 family)
VSPDWEAALSIVPERLEAQLGYLARRGYRGITFAEALKSGQGKRVAVTFDDGYRSVIRLARPILEAYGMPGTVFVATDFVGTERPMRWPGIDHWLDGPHASELMPMSWEEARELTEMGWEIGSHTCSHPRLTELDDARLREELEASRARCEEALEQPCESLAYPYGDVDSRVAEAARAAGYSAAAALLAEPGPPSSYRWPRIGIYHVDDDRSFRLKVWRPLRWLRRSRGWGLIESAIRPFRPTSR